MTCLFDQAVLLLGEIRRWSLLRLKQLTLSHGHLTIILITTIICCSLPLFKCSSFILPYPCRLLELVLCHLVLVTVTLYSFLVLVEHLWAQKHGWVLTVQAAKKNDTKHYFTLFFYTKYLSGSVNALWCWIILKSLFSASLIACDGVLRVHSQMSVTQHLHGLPCPLLPGACQCMMVLHYPDSGLYASDYIIYFIIMYCIGQTNLCFISTSEKAHHSWFFNVIALPTLIGK